MGLQEVVCVSRGRDNGNFVSHIFFGGGRGLVKLLLRHEQTGPRETTMENDSAKDLESPIGDP